MNDFNTVFLHRNNLNRWVDPPSDFHNRSFLFGDGLFETMVFSKGIILDFDLHVQRLREGMTLLNLSAENLSDKQNLERIISQSDPCNLPLRIRWNVFRSGQGKYSPETSLIEESIQIQAFQKAPELKRSAMISNEFQLFPNRWANCKTSNALVYVLANQERIYHQKEEIILLDDQGNVSEAGASNIFWKKDGEFYTPSLKTNCIAGIGRAKICNAINKNRYKLNEGEFTIYNLLEADKVFTSNVTGISYIQEINGKTFATDQELFLEELFMV